MIAVAFDAGDQVNVTASMHSYPLVHKAVVRHWLAFTWRRRRYSAWSSSHSFTALLSGTQKPPMMTVMIATPIGYQRPA